MEDESRAADLLRQARALVEQAQGLIGPLPVAQGGLEIARQILAELGGPDPVTQPCVLMTCPRVPA